MRILLVTGIFPPDHGGPASYVPAIAQALAAKHEVLAVLTLSDSVQPDESDYRFPVVRIARRQSALIRWCRTIWRIRRLARRADVVYLNGLVLEGVIACKLSSRRRVVVKVVGDLIWEKARNAEVTQLTIDEFQQARLSRKWTLLKSLQSWYMRKADLIIVPSRYLAGIVAGWGVSTHRIAVVYNAINLATPKEIDKEWDLVTVARLVPWKGVDALIRLAAVHGWSLLVVGDGPLRGTLENLVVELGVQGKIRFTGHVAKEAVTRYIQSARIFVLNSSYEGLPHIVLEAKGVGVPVVATAVGGTPEAIVDGVDGFLIPRGDDQALASTIYRLLSDGHLRQRIGTAGQDFVRDQFSFESMVLETERRLADAVSASSKTASCAI